jgi:MFS family permease
VQTETTEGTPWYRLLSGYHWFVLAVSSLGWMFDTMAQQLFSLARKPAVQDLMGRGTSDALVSEQAGYTTMIFMVGWALGGIVFGIFGDRWGRVKTMTATILSYSVFTGFGFFVTNLTEFNVLRFLSSLGVGGQFAIGVTLVAEVIPANARPQALGMLQAVSALGNMLAGLAGILIGHAEQVGALSEGWRYLFLAGALPAPLALVVFRKLREPEQWLQSRAEKRRMGSFGDLFADAWLRRNSVVGLVLAFAGVVGLWGIGYFSYDLFRPVLDNTFRAEGFRGADLAGKITTWIGITSLLQNFGAFWGVHWFTFMTGRLGRRKAFAIALTAAMLMTALTFWKLERIDQLFWMIPLMGFTQLALFGGYAIYLPELFPTRLRSTGVSFCYNAGRLVAAVGPLGMGLLTSRVYHGPDAMRYAGMTLCLVFLFGLAALPFAPETKDQPLPA